MIRPIKEMFIHIVQASVAPKPKQFFYKSDHFLDKIDVRTGS